MTIHVFLTATTDACPQARTSTPSTAWPALRPTGRRMAGGTGRQGGTGRRSRYPFGLGGRG
ncbi:hypothetical protein QNO08_17045 [Arthrobacter sp. zg-Y820]|uniref:hypothetical protein n=1 Tax=unclassified Arthrobacter TaxID=235627 RepID=UPI001E57BCED|nr:MULTISPECIES: hypothetical protein [unclassified Arthrobacter]MCC9197346.1 hypothetical protein [Arthrobacter sp. zg-Y820]MDK1280211.1 hypothetical protein [Arthrobacter sp. zg.Y820]MDK1360653.1 hypothetical protein [Arthrobacter sp. zg-Y1219]WIB09502.1 hypothetical protein QNO08_17045 [Arthrobacter sp. zg-Y820]